MARIKPTHIKAVAEVLQEAWDTPEDAAKAAIAKLDELRELDTSYSVIVKVAGFHVGYHGFSTPNEAHKAIARGNVGGGAVGLREITGVLPMYHHTAALRAIAAADEPPKVKGDFAAIAEDAKEFKDKPRRSRKW